MRAIEATRPKTLRVGVVRHDVRRYVPGQVAPALEAVLGLVQVDREAATAGRSAGSVENVDGGRGAALHAELRTLLELIVVEVARTAGQRQYLRDQIKIDGGEKCSLPVTAPHVLAERR